MINIEQIQNEIEIVKETIISNEEQLLHFKEKYLTRSGILPQIYSEIGKMKGINASICLYKMIELRHFIDEKIKSYRG
mgnify:FL=1